MVIRCSGRGKPAESRHCDATTDLPLVPTGYRTISTNIVLPDRPGDCVVRARDTTHRIVTSSAASARDESCPEICGDGEARQLAYGAYQCRSARRVWDFLLGHVSRKRSRARLNGENDHFSDGVSIAAPNSWPATIAAHGLTEAEITAVVECASLGERRDDIAPSFEPPR